MNLHKMILKFIITLSFLIFKVYGMYYKLEEDNEKCFLDDINKGSVN